MVELPPAGPLYRHREGVWVKESWVRFFGLTLQTRMVVLKLEEGLLLHSPSPAPLDEATRREVHELGEVRWLLAPNEIHNLGLLDFQRTYPTAHTTGCVGHRRRVRGAHFDVLLDSGSLADAVPWTRKGEVDLHVIGGNRLLHEIALLHRASRTLVLADAVEFIDSAQLAGRLPGAGRKALMRGMGLTLGVPCMSPEHNLYCADPDALARSLGVLLGWNFDSLIVAHGRITQGGEARRALESAFETTIVQVRRRGPVARAIWSLASRLQ